MYLGDFEKYDPSFFCLKVETYVHEYWPYTELQTPPLRQFIVPQLFDGWYCVVGYIGRKVVGVVAGGT